MAGFDAKKVKIAQDAYQELFSHVDQSGPSEEDMVR
jgi:hypothetical protein